MDKPEFRVERGPAATDEAFAIGMAKLLEREGRTIAAAELRRLHAENEALRNVANRGGHIAVAMSRIDQLEAQRDALLEVLKEAATSLETVGRLAGKSDYLGDDGERIPTYMGRHDEVREYAISRAGVARAAIKAVEEGK